MVRCVSLVVVLLAPCIVYTGSLPACGTGTYNTSQPLAAYPLGSGNGDLNAGTGPTVVGFPPPPPALGAVALSSNVGGNAVPQGIQTWTVGSSGAYFIVAAGAAGAYATSYLGGSGIVVSTTYTFTKGQTVAISVGQNPFTCTTSGFFGGGGGTFVSIFAGTGAFSSAAQHTPVLVAGGGGAGAASAGANGVLGTSGTLCPCCSGTVASNGGGGGGGNTNGGNAAVGTSVNGIANSAGGGGFYYKGGDAYAANTFGGNAFASSTGPSGGQSNGVGVGTACGGPPTPQLGSMGFPYGGFGGGGGGWNSGGGGGGYSGGQGGPVSPVRCGGGGGGSYDANNAANGYTATQYTTWNTTLLGPPPMQFSAGYSTGNGFVYIVPVGVCASCGAGFYGNGGLTCAACPANTYSTVGTAVCSTCPTNTVSSGSNGSCSASIGNYVGPAASPARVPASPYMSAATVTISGEVFVASASSSFGGASNELPYNAFSGVTSTSGTPNQWTAAGPYYSGTGNTCVGCATTTVGGVIVTGEWLQLQTQTPRAYGSYALQADYGNQQRMPTSFVLAGSNDGIIWTQIDSRTGVSAFSSLQIQTFNIPNAGWNAYSFIRLIIVASGTNNYLSIDEFMLYPATVNTCTASSCVTGSLPFGHCTSSGTAVCCGAGTYFVDGVSTACQTCPAGTYGTGTTSCTPCPVNTTSVAGSSLLSACTACPSYAWAGVGSPMCYNTTYPVFALITEWTGNAVRKMDLATATVSTIASGISNPAGVAISPLGDYALVTNNAVSKVQN